MDFKQITKKEFKDEGKAGLLFCGSGWLKNDPSITFVKDTIKKNILNTGIKYPARTLQNNTDSSLKFKTDNNKYSYLNIAGSRTKIYSYNGFFVVWSRYEESTSIVIYSIDF